MRPLFAWGGIGDNWYMNWAADDRQYISLCDGFWWKTFLGRKSDIQRITLRPLDLLSARTKQLKYPHYEFKTRRIDLGIA